MALPSLQHQIGFVDAIVVARAIKTDWTVMGYQVEEVIKSRSNSIEPKAMLNVDLTIFELMGYSIDDGQLIVILLAEKANGFDCIDFLPVTDHHFEYGADDKSVYRNLSLEDFRKLCANVDL